MGDRVFSTNVAGGNGYSEAKKKGKKPQPKPYTLCKNYSKLIRELNVLNDIYKPIKWL